jgi:hypothetical protein
LNKISPNDGLYSADRGVERRQQGHKENSPEIDPNIDADAGKEILPDYLDDDTAEIQADTDSQDPREKKNAAGQIFGPRTEADFEKFVDTLDSVAIVGTDKSERDEDTRQNGADR